MISYDIQRYALLSFTCIDKYLIESITNRQDIKLYIMHYKSMNKYQLTIISIYEIKNNVCAIFMIINIYDK